LHYSAPLIRALLDYVARYKFIYVCMYVCMYVTMYVVYTHELHAGLLNLQGMPVNKDLLALNQSINQSINQSVS